MKFFHPMFFFHALSELKLHPAKTDFSMNDRGNDRYSFKKVKTESVLILDLIKKINGI